MEHYQFSINIPKLNAECDKFRVNNQKASRNRNISLNYSMNMDYCNIWYRNEPVTLVLYDKIRYNI